jgi:hypothetical protein
MWLMLRLIVEILLSLFVFQVVLFEVAYGQTVAGVLLLVRAPQFDKHGVMYRGADKSLARPGRKQATATEDFEFHISYL